MSDSSSLFSKGHWERVKCVAGRFTEVPWEARPGAGLGPQHQAARNLDCCQTPVR